MSANRGTIGLAWLARCGRCGGTDYATFDKRHNAERHFVALGWLHTRFRGWVCPECAEQGDNDR